MPKMCISISISRNVCVLSPFVKVSLYGVCFVLEQYLVRSNPSFSSTNKMITTFLSLSLSGLLVCHVFYNSKCSLCACHQMWMLAISIEMPPCSKMEHPLLLINLMPHNRNCNCIWSSRLNANGRAMMKLRQCILHFTICQVWFQIYCPEMNSFMNEEKA